MQAGLMKVKTKTSKFEAQLEFRKKVFEQNPVDKCFTQKKGNQIEEVCSNLRKLFPPRLAVTRKVSLVQESSMILNEM